MTTEEKAKAYAEKELVRTISRPAHPLNHIAQRSICRENVES